MKTIKLILPVMIAFTILFATSCSKDEGFEGKKDIKGSVSYPGGVASGAIVTVAFGQSSATTQVDFTTITDANGNFSFSGLEKGDYYMDATYTDNFGMKFDCGGAYVKIGNRKDELTVNFTLQ